MGPWIWFTLLLYSDGHWYYVHAFETLEQCQEYREKEEKVAPGNYFCLPTNVLKTKASVK